MATSVLRRRSISRGKTNGGRGPIATAALCAVPPLYQQGARERADGLEVPVGHMVRACRTRHGDAGHVPGHAVFAKARKEGKLVPYSAHNPNFIVDLSAIPVDTKGATTEPLAKKQRPERRA